MGIADRRRARLGTGTGQQQPAFQPTQPGDPDFSMASTPSSTAFYPAAAAEKSLYNNRRYAENVIESARAAGMDTSQSQYDPLNEAAQSGFTERASTIGENLLKFIDGGYQATNLLLQDLFSDPDDESMRDPTIFDYADALWMGIEDEEKFKLETGLEPSSGSHTLDLFGWAPVGADETGFGAGAERVFRGFADFALRVGIDPLTYVTGGLSGLGKNVAKATGEKTMKDLVEEIIPAYKKGILDPEQISSEYGQRIAKMIDDDAAAFLDDLDLENMAPDAREALFNYLKRVDPEKMADVKPSDNWALLAGAQENAAELALRNRIHDEVVSPLIRRQFKDVNPLAKELLPKYAQGGIRISVPFTRRSLEKGLVVPGTTGLGRDIVGDPLRKMSARLREFSPAYNKIADGLDSSLNALDRDRALLKGLGRKSRIDPETGKTVRGSAIEGWQWAIARQAMDRLSNVEHKEFLKTTLNSMKDDLQVTGKKFFRGTDEEVEEQISKLWPEIMNRLEKRQVDSLLSVGSTVDAATGIPVPSQTGLYQELDTKIDEIVEFLRTNFDEYHKQLAALNPVLKKKYIDGYVPHTVNEKIAAVFGKMAGEGATVSRKEIERMGRSSNRGHILFAQLVNAVTSGGRLESQLGAARAMDQRAVGRLKALTLTDSGNVMFDGDWLRGMADDAPAGPLLEGGEVVENALDTKFLSVTEMNELLEPVIRDVAERNGINLPKNWDGKVFNENPLDVAMGYIDNLDDAVGTWGMIEAMKTAGLAFHHGTAPNAQGILQQVYANAVKNTEKVIMRRPTAKAAAEAAQRGERPAAAVAEAAQVETRQGALRAWADRPASIRQSVERAVRGEELDPRETQEVEALSSWWREKAAPTPGLFRGMEVGSPPQVGETFDVPMANATKNINEAESFAGDEGWVVVFDDATLAAANPENTAVPLVSGRFTVTEVDESGRKMLVTAERTEDILPQPRQAAEAAPTPQPAGSKRVSLDTEETTHWKTTAERKRVLKGFDEAAESSGVEGIPLRALGETQRKGLGGVENARGIFDILRGGKEAFRARRGAPIDPLPQLPREGIWSPGPTRKTAGWETEEIADTGSTASIYRDKDGNPLARVYIDKERGTGKLTGIGFDVAEGARPMTVARAIYQRIDELVEDGSLELTPQNIDELLSTEQMTTQGADMMYGYLRSKLRQLDPKVQEYLAGTPEEVLSFVDAMEGPGGFMEMFNDFFTRYGAIVHPDGTLDTSKALVAGDQEFIDYFNGLKEAAKSLSDVHGFDTAVKLFRNMPDPLGLALDEGYVNPGIFALGGPAIEGLTIQSDIAKWLRQASRNSASIYTPEGIASLKMGTHTVLKWWKAMATIARPGFHIRNVIGGIWNNMIVGVGPKAYADTSTHGITIRNALRRGEDFETALSHLPPDEAHIWKTAFDNDVLNGFATSEFRGLTSAEKRNRLAWAKVWDVDDFALTRIGGKFMESIEDFLRMSAFRTWYDPANPGSAQVAKEMSNLVHFDYMNLTPFETRVKEIVPFFVWMRRNLPLQIQQFMENPRMIRRYQHMMGSLDDMWADEEGGDMPIGEHYSAFAAKTGWTVNEGTPFWARAMIDPDLPVRDIIELPRPNVGELFQFATDRLGPHLSTVMNLNEQREFGDVNAPAGMSAVLKSLAAVGLYDTTMDGDVRVPYHWRTLQETILPISRDIINPLTGGSPDPNQRARAGIAPETGFFEGGAKTLGTTALNAMGVRFSTPSDTRGTAARSQDELQQIVEQLRLQGQVPPSEQGGDSDPYGIFSGLRG